MNAIVNPTANVLQWYAVRMVPAGNGHRRSAVLGAEFETYRNRAGRMVKRRIPGTGKRIFVPEHIMQRAGFDVFLPIKKVLQRQNRFKPEKQLVSYPLLADWLFVGWPAGECRWSDLMALGVVAGVLGMGGRPVLVSPQMIQKLMRRWGSGVMPKMARELRQALEGVNAGDSLRIVAGPFEGVDATVVDLNGAGAKVMLKLFGRDTPAQMPLDDLARAEPDDGCRKGPVLEVVSSNRYCSRCSGTMVQDHRNCYGHHVRCRDCGSVAALNSSTAQVALARWLAHQS